MQNTKTPDWIDEVFDKLDGRVVDEATRFRLISLLDSACIEGDEDDRCVLVASGVRLNSCP